MLITFFAGDFPLEPEHVGNRDWGAVPRVGDEVHVAGFARSVTRVEWCDSVAGAEGPGKLQDPGRVVVYLGDPG